MKRLTIGFVAALFVLSAATSSLRAVGVGSYAIVTGAGNGVFPNGAEFSGISLSGSTFGQGIEVSGGSAVGAFQTTLTGTTLAGAAANIRFDGRVGGGSVNSDGSVTFSGYGWLALGDGSPQQYIPFSVTATTAGLTLVLGTTTLPTQTVDPDSIYIG